jgi:integrase/recombinase XerD
LSPYGECTIEDVYSAINVMQAAKSIRGPPLKQNTKHDYVVAIRQFLLWLIENGHSSIPREKVREIRIPQKDMTTTTPDQILTPDEIKAIIEACQGSRDRSRDRALITTLYETGCRVGELARLRWKDLVFDTHGVKVSITDTKTNKIRFVRLVMSKEYLIQWRNDTHGGRGPDDPVFVSSRWFLPLDYGAVRMILMRAVKKAKIKKRVHLHLLRKSRITHLLRDGLPETVVKEIMWGNASTDMIRTYARLSTNDIDSAMLAHYGIEKKDEKKRDSLSPYFCPSCGTSNPPTNKYCSKCGVVFEVEEFARMVHDDPRFKILLQFVQDGRFDKLCEMENRSE